MQDNRKPIDRSEALLLQLRAHTALFEMANGTARRQEWDDLADAINLVEALCEMDKLGDPASLLHFVWEATEGMKEAIGRPDGLMRMRAGQNVALRQVVCAWDDAVGKFSRGTIQLARQRVLTKIQLAKIDDSLGVAILQSDRSTETTWNQSQSSSR